MPLLVEYIRHMPYGTRDIIRIRIFCIGTKAVIRIDKNLMHYELSFAVVYLIFSMQMIGHFIAGGIKL